MTYQRILVEIQEGICWITLNSEANMNAFNQIMIDELLDATATLEENNNIKVVVISGKGKIFSGGGDIGEMIQGVNEGVPIFESTVPAIGQLAYQIKKSKKLYLASVYGAVAGAAFNLMLACDFAVAAEGTKMLQAFVKIGLIPDAGGLYLLSKAIGVNKAMHLALTGDNITAQQGMEMGFVYRVVPKEELESTVSDLAQNFVKGPSIAYETMKTTMFESGFSDFKDYLDLEIKGQILCGTTQDYREGIKAFFEKRSPNFKGV